MTGSVHNARFLHTTSILTDGKVLVTGGRGFIGIMNSTELYDPLTETWTIIDSMKIARELHTASILTNGKLLITGGRNYDDDLKSTELYYPL
ncbi:unnamed protein product [Adineta steineri]|nr:unnamed protein product [Adineta steineri]